jgi:hypothetical protein
MEGQGVLAIPKFFYGAISVTNIVAGEKKIFYPTCLYSFALRRFRVFKNPSDLTRSVKELLDFVESEELLLVNEEFYSKKITSEADDCEDFLECADASEENNMVLIRRGRLRNFSRNSDIDAMFAEKITENDEEEAIRKKSKGKRMVKRNIIPQYISSISGYEVAVPKEIEDVEKSDMFFEPFYTEEDFTNNIGLLPKELREKFEFINLDVIAALRNVVEEVFYDIRRDRSFKGLSNTESIEADWCLSR